MKTLTLIRSPRRVANLCVCVLLLSNFHQSRAQETGVIRLSEDHRRRLVRVLKDIEKGKSDADRIQVRALTAQVERGDEIEAEGGEARGDLIRLLSDYHSISEYRSLDARYILVELGHTNEIKSVVAELLGKRTWANLSIEAGLELSRQPRLIAELGPLLAREESIKTPLINNEMRVYPPSVGAAHVIAAVLANSPAFDASTRAWAAQLRNLWTEPKRAVLRVWWQKNAAHFANGTYNLVRPLPAGDFVIKKDDFFPQPGRRID